MPESPWSAVGNPTSALGPSGSSFGPSGLAVIGIHHLLPSNLTTGLCHGVVTADDAPVWRRVRYDTIRYEMLF